MVSNRFIIRAAAVTAGLFLIVIIYLMASFNTTQILSTENTQIHTDLRLYQANCIRNISGIQNEVEMLKEQIRELQQLQFEERSKFKVSNQHTPNCVDKVDFDEKLAKSEASNAHNYPSERHVPIYTRFDMWHQYYVHSVSGEKVMSKLNGVQRKHIDEVIDNAVLLLNDSRWRRDHFLEGIYHTVETIGSHYELHFVNDNLERKVVTLFRPQAPSIALRHHSIIDKEEQITIVIPLHQKSEAFKQFLANFESILKKFKYSLHLTIVYFGETVRDLMKVFQPFILKHNYRSYSVEHISGKNFSRSYALDTGIRRWKGKGDPLLFLCDVDVIFKVEFIQRCRSYTARQRQVYYPIVFSLYNPKVIQEYLSQKFNNLKDRLKVSPEYGFWRDFGYGMTCLYRSDYIESGGFNTGLEEWGEEDILLFRKFAQSNLTVVRAPDPDIFHLWHSKICNASLSDVHYRQCIKSKILNEGSHAELGYMVLQQEIERRNSYV